MAGSSWEASRGYFICALPLLFLLFFRPWAFAHRQRSFTTGGISPRILPADFVSSTLQTPGDSPNKRCYPAGNYPRVFDIFSHFSGLFFQARVEDYCFCSLQSSSSHSSGDSEQAYAHYFCLPDYCCSSEQPFDSQVSDCPRRIRPAGPENLSTALLSTFPIHQSHKPTNSLHRDGWELTPFGFSVPDPDPDPEVVSPATTSTQQLLPATNNFPAVSNHQSPTETILPKSNSIEDCIGLSYTGSTNSAGLSISSKDPASPVSPLSFPEFDIGPEDVEGADQPSNSGALRPIPPSRREKSRVPSIRHTERLPCPRRPCAKTFPRQCDLTKHLKTHNREFKCEVPGCRSQGYYRMQDLIRHKSSCHGAFDVGGKVFCKYQDCEYATRGFARNDNCHRHMRLKHGFPNGLEPVK